MLIATSNRVNRWLCAMFGHHWAVTLIMFGDSCRDCHRCQRRETM